MSQPRRSTDEGELQAGAVRTSGVVKWIADELTSETAPLLDQDRRRNDSLFSALLHPARPLTNLEKILAGGAVLLLLLTSTFIGLFAGAEHALKKRPENGVVTVTSTVGTATTTVGSSPTGSPSSVS